MNIFILSQDPHKAAQYMCDKHVVKLLLESAQMLSTVSGGPYKPTHANHPCTLWAGAARDNYHWLVEHALELCREYTYRYGRTHKCEPITLQLASPPPHIPRGGTPFVQCMPDEFRHPTDPVAAYRAYYHSKTFAAWNRGRPAPSWWEPHLE